MKKIIALIIVACLIGTSVFAITKCEKKEEANLSEKVGQKISAYRTDLEDSATTLTTAKAIKNYLCNWADAKGIDYTIDDYDNIIMKVKASKAYKDADPTVILCSYDPDHFNDCIDPISVALYLVKNNENTGKLNVIFTKEDSHNFEGIDKLDDKYFTDETNVFCLNGGSKNMWSTSTAYSSEYKFTKDVDYETPSGNIAYKIKISGLPGGVPDLKIASYPNPIKELGDLLAYFKTNSVIYELAEIEGGNSGKLYPKEASAVIVIDEDYQEKFEKRITTAIDNYNSDFAEHYPLASYTYEKIKLPKKVLSNDDMNTFVSLLYTLVDGVYERDEEDEIVSITNIGAISSDGDTYSIYASGNSMTEKDLNQIDLSYTTICGLSNVKYKKTDTHSGWSIEKPEENQFVQQVADAFKEYSDGQMEYRNNISTTNASSVYEKNPNCNIMNITVNQARIEKYAGTLITFMINQTETIQTN